MHSSVAVLVCENELAMQFFGSLFRSIWQILFAQPKKFFSEGNEGRAYALPLTLDRLLLLLVFDDGGLAHNLVQSFCQHLPNLEAALISR